MNIIQKRIRIKGLPSAVLMFCIAFGSFLVSQAHAQEQPWCGQIVPPPSPPPPDQPPPCCDCEENCKGSPNFVGSGNYSTSAVDLALPTRGFPLTMARTYDSVRLLDGSFGIGWFSPLLSRLSYTTYLYEAPSTYYKEAVVNLPSGRPARFRENTDGSFSAIEPNYDTLVKNPDGTFDLTPKQSRSRYHYTAEGALESVTDEYGNSLLFQYDANGRLERVSDGTGSGRNIDFYYGGDGRISSVVDSAGRSVSYSYNAQGAMTSSTDTAGRQTNYSYTNGRYAPMLTQIKDHWSRVITTITYDSFDRTATYTDRGETYTYTYNYQGDPTKTGKTDSAGRVWVFVHDSQGLVTMRFPPMGQGGGATSSSFTPQGSPILTIDEVGVRTAYTYNANGTVAMITRDEQQSLAVRFDYSYDANFSEKVISIIAKNPSTGLFNPNWQSWKYDYYPPGSASPGALHHVYRVRTDGTTLDALATYTYNSSGQVVSVTDASGAVTTYQYDSVTGDLVSVTYPRNSDFGGNPSYSYSRDAAGRVTSVTDPLGKVTTYTYDGADRILTVTLPKPVAGSPLNFVTSYSYDNFDVSSGLLFTHQTDPNNRLTKQGYDQYGQFVKSIDAAGNSTSFAYNKGLLSSITDSNNNVTGYTYNGLRRLTTTTFPNGTTEVYTYTTDGLLSTKRDRKNQTITYDYDHLKRLKAKIYPTSAIMYNYTGQLLTSVTDNFAGETHTFTYDSSYRIASSTQGTRGTISYTYAAGDRIVSYSVSGGASAQFGHFDDGSLKSIDWSPVAGTFLYTYRLNGQYDTIAFPSGQSRTYTYDDQGRLLQIANSHVTAGNLGTFAYGYDIDNTTGQPTMLGQRSSMSADGNTSAYYYDANYQLTRSDYPSGAPLNGEVHTWGYDPIGNRLHNTINGNPQTYAYYTNGGNPNNGQRLQSDGTYTYTYDANGNTATKTGSEGTYTSTWDYENRMTAISGPDLTAIYTYDYLGRRKSKTVNGVTTTYLYDGQNLIRETAATTADYVFGPGIDEPLAVNTGGVTHYYAVDGLGSVTALASNSGTIANSYVTDAWGVMRSANETVGNPFTYTARETGEAGLMYYRARYYQPRVGMFTSEDPYGRPRPKYGVLAAYTYIGSDPTAAIDPYGLYEIDKSCDCPTFDPPPDFEGPGMNSVSNGVIEVCEKILKKEPCRRFLVQWFVAPGGISQSMYECLSRHCLSDFPIYCNPDRYDDCGETPPGGVSMVIYHGMATCPIFKQGSYGATIFHEGIHTCGISDEPGGPGASKDRTNFANAMAICTGFTD